MTRKQAEKAVKAASLCSEKVTIEGMVVGAGEDRLDIRIGDFDDKVFFTLPKGLFKIAKLKHKGKPVT